MCSLCAESPVENILEFESVHLGRAGGSGSLGHSATVGRLSREAALCHHLGQSRPHEPPRPVVLVFFLHEGDLGRRGVSAEHFLQVVVGEGGDLFQTDDGTLLLSAGLERVSAVLEVVVDLSLADHDVGHLVCGREHLIIQHFLETLVSQEVFHVAAGLLESQEFLRREHHERLPNIPEQLSTQEMEVVDSRGGVAELEIATGGLFSGRFVGEVIVIVAHLEESHHAGRGVFGAEAVESVGQEQGDVAGLFPLGLG